MPHKNATFHLDQPYAKSDLDCTLVVSIKLLQVQYFVQFLSLFAFLCFCVFFFGLLCIVGPFFYGGIVLKALFALD